MLWTLPLTVWLACVEPPPPAPQGWALERPEVTLGLVDAVLGLRRLREPLGFGVVEAGEGCPAVGGASLELESGTRTWSGGCTSPEGLRWEGELELRWTRADGAFSERWEGAGFAVQGPGVEVQAAALDGVWEAEGGEDAEGEWLEERVQGAVGLLWAGEPEALPVPVEGSWSLTGAWTPAQALHLVEAGLVVPGFGALGARLELIQTTGACASGLPDAGSLVLEDADQRLEVDLSSAGACVGCWGWSVNGEAQAEPLCR